LTFAATLSVSSGWVDQTSRTRDRQPQNVPLQ
jgi:hypothetical protein